MFKELIVRRTEAQRALQFLQRNTGENLPVQEASRYRSESDQILSQAEKWLPLIERVIAGYCEAINGDKDSYRMFVEGKHIIVSDQSVSSYLPYQLIERHWQRIRSSFSLEENYSLLAALRSHRHRQVDSILLDNRSRWVLAPLHGRVFEFVVTSTGFRVQRVVDIHQDSEVDILHKRYLEVELLPDSLLVQFRSDRLSLSYQVSSIAELATKITEIELQIQEKYCLD